MLFPLRKLGNGGFQKFVIFGGELDFYNFLEGNFSGCIAM
jgi:hypothetical protein